MNKLQKATRLARITARTFAPGVSMPSFVMMYVTNPNDIELRKKFEQAKLHSGLILYLLEPSFADRITNAISNVVDELIAGRIRSGIGEQPYGDTATIAQYLESLRGLRLVLHPNRVE